MSPLDRVARVFLLSNNNNNGVHTVPQQHVLVGSNGGLERHGRCHQRRIQLRYDCECVTTEPLGLSFKAVFTNRPFDTALFEYAILVVAEDILSRKCPWVRPHIQYSYHANRPRVCRPLRTHGTRPVTVTAHKHIMDQALSL